MKRSDNILHFINYQRRELHDTFKISPEEELKEIKHSPEHGVFTIITSKSLRIIDDYSLEEKKIFEGEFRKVMIKLSGEMLILSKKKKIIKRNIYDDNMNEEIILKEGEIEDAKISTNELYFAAKLKNPYSLAIWVNSQENHLFNFNENNKFENFIFEGDGEEIGTYAVCYDEDYIKIWDCDYGCFRQNYDYSR